MTLKNPKIGGWYRQKTFSHLDYSLDFEQARKLVESSESIASHSFLPFLGYTDSKRRYAPGKIRSKNRDIKFCSHVDGYIHAYYAKKFSNYYESYIDHKSWKKCVIGYRSGIGTNIHMARNAFSEIIKRESCVALAIDISDFFGSIDHNLLTENIKLITGEKRLPKDVVKVVRSMTNYAWVDKDALIDILELDKKKLPRRLCKIEEFRKIKKEHSGLVEVNDKVYGIPQGSPLSAVFSNIYMIDFDKAMSSYMKKIGGYYRRYSDDIFVVCDQNDFHGALDFVKTEISKLGKFIEIKDEKTEISNFHTSLSGELVCDRPITYLGFTFDGTRTLLRDRTLSRYYRRMTYATRRAASGARSSNNTKIFKRKLNTQFTHHGKSNFYSYAKKASEILGDPTPKRQLKRHVKILDRKLRSCGK